MIRKVHRPPNLASVARCLWLLASVGGCGGEAASARFVLQNGGEVPLWVQGGEWLTLSQDGAPISMRLGCTQLCDEEQTYVCGAPLRMAVEVAPGERAETSWDGSYGVWNEADGCTEEREAAEGDGFTARFCWASAYEELGWEAVTVEPVCAEQPFVADDGQEVHRAATVQLLEDEVSFVLENGRSETIYVQATAACSAEPAWFTVRDSQEEPLALFADCGVCSCADPGCQEACPEPCAAPTVIELLPGETVTHVWNGQRYLRRAAPACEQLATAPRGPYAVEICWGSGHDGTLASGTVTGRACGMASFNLAADPEARVVASP